MLRIVTNLPYDRVVTVRGPDRPGHNCYMDVDFCNTGAREPFLHPVSPDPDVIALDALLVSQTAPAGASFTRPYSRGRTSMTSWPRRRCCRAARRTPNREFSQIPERMPRIPCLWAGQRRRQRQRTVPKKKGLRPLQLPLRDAATAVSRLQRSLFFTRTGASTTPSTHTSRLLPWR